MPEKLPPKTGSFSAEVVIGATTHYCYGSNTGGEKLLLRLTYRMKINIQFRWLVNRKYQHCKQFNVLTYG